MKQGLFVRIILANYSVTSNRNNCVFSSWLKLLSVTITNVQCPLGNKGPQVPSAFTLLPPV